MARGRDIQEALTLVRAGIEILNEEKTCLAEREDCDYFRQLYQSSRAPLPPPLEKLSPPPKVFERAPTAPPSCPAAPKIAAPQPVSASPHSEKDLGFHEIQKILAKIAGQIPILPDPPSDAPARAVAERWKTKNQSTPFSLLSFNEPAPQRQFLLHLAQALDVVFGGCSLIDAAGIEKENQWEAFLSTDVRLAIICDCALWQLPHLLPFYREIPSSSVKFLLNAPLFLLPDLTLYWKDPLLKRSLWKALCLKINSK